jgi:hypothetical protein
MPRYVCGPEAKDELEFWGIPGKLGLPHTTV